MVYYVYSANPRPMGKSFMQSPTPSQFATKSLHGASSKKYEILITLYLEQHSQKLRFWSIFLWGILVGRTPIRKEEKLNRDSQCSMENNDQYQ